MKRKIVKTILVLVFALLFVGAVRLVVISFRIDWLTALGGIVGFVGMLIIARVVYEFVNEEQKKQ